MAHKEVIEGNRKRNCIKNHRRQKITERIIKYVSGELLKDS